MNSLTDFKNAIGERFKVVDGDGKPFSGLLGQHDVICSVDDKTQEIEGEKFIAHYSTCRFIQEQPVAFKTVNT